MRVVKICPLVNKPICLISQNLSSPEVGLISGDLL